MNERTASCETCSAQVLPDAAYCHRCGARLTGDRSRGEAGMRGEAERVPGAAGERMEGPSTPPEGAGRWAESPSSPSKGAVGRAGSESNAAAWGSASGSAASTSAAGSSDAASTSAAGSSDDASRGVAPGGTGPSGASAAASGADAGGRPDSNGGLERVLRGEYAVDIGAWMSRGWEVFTRSGGLFIAQGAIVWAILTFAAPLLIVLGPALLAGFYAAALIVRRGQPLRFSDFWLSFNDFLPLFLAGIVGGALLFAGLLTCGIATVYLFVAYHFALPLIIDRGTDFWDALETSRRVVTKHWFAMMAFAALLVAINVVAFVVTFSLGLVVSLPLTSCAVVEAYAGVLGVRGRIPGREPVPAAEPVPRP